LFENTGNRNITDFLTKGIKNRPKISSCPRNNKDSRSAKQNACCEDQHNHWVLILRCIIATAVCRRIIRSATLSCYAVLCLLICPSDFLFQ